MGKKNSDLAIAKWLTQKTFEIQHCPNCPSPFLVRLAAPNTGRLDRKPYVSIGVENPDLTKDILGFGETLIEAAEDAKWKLWLAEVAGQEHG